MQTRSLVKDRARRNLLLLIDGNKSEELLLGSLSGISAEDFQELRKLDLIAPAAGAVTVGTGPRPGHVNGEASSSARPTMPAALAVPLDYGQFTAELTKLISANLGLRGFTLTLAVERAGTIEELQTVAQRVLEQIGDRKGEAAASDARKTLYGG